MTTAIAVLLTLLLCAPQGAVGAAPAFSQIEENAPGLSGGIGPWSGAPRGHFTNVEPRSLGFTLTAILADPDSAQGVDYEILIDGVVEDSGSSTNRARAGAAATITANIDVEPGVHRVCLRLADRANAGRTVDCTDAVTTPPNRASSALVNNANGVVVSPSGVVVPVVSGTSNNWQVTTPCGNTTNLRSGTYIPTSQIVIDPGHGGIETGAVGSGGLIEKDLNLVVSELVIDKFEDLGISATITRSGDYRVPIGTRAEIATSLAADVFISIHHNGGAVRRSSVPGTEVFYSEVRPESQRLAAILYEEMNAAAAQFSANWVSTVNQGASVRLRDEGDDLYGIHRFSPQIDSVITEFMYLSNPSEAALLQRADVLEAQAQSIVDGVLRWWFEDDQGTSLGRRFTDSSSSGTGGFDNCTDPSLTSGTVGTFGLNNLSVAETDQTSIEGNLSTGLLPTLGLGVDPALTAEPTASERS